MGYIQEAKKLCIERDSNRCRHCGTNQNLFVKQLTKRKGPSAWHLSNLITVCGDCLDKSQKILETNTNRVGVLLAGGKGKRMAPLTKFQNKHTLPIALTPMIMYPLKTLRTFGTKRVLIVLDRETAGQITNILGSGKEFGIDISYKIQEGSFGIGDALYLAKDFIKPGDEEIVTILGDNIFDNDTIDTTMALGNNKACIFTKKVPNPRDYGVAILNDGGKVKEVIEKPTTNISDLAVLGLYIYKPDVFSVIEKISPSARNEIEISFVNDIYAKEGSLIHKEITGYWSDAGSSINSYCLASLYGAKQAKISAEEVDKFVSIIFDNK